MGVTSVSLGNFYTDANGKTVLGGAGGSGLDSKTLIEGLVQAKSYPVTKSKDAIAVNDKTSTALNDFNTLLKSFESASDVLRSPSGINNESSDIFKYTKGSITNGGSAYVSITTSPSADVQTYSISNISSLATNSRQATGVFNVASTDADATTNNGGAHFNTGTFIFKGASIEIDAGDSLTNIASKFNAVKGTTGVAVSIINVDTGHYELSFASTKTGVSSAFNLSSATDPSNVLGNLSLSATTTGTNASFKLNGITITRESNSISDVVNGVTFNLQATTPDAVTTYGVNVEPDTTAIRNAIVNYLNAYNDLKTFAAKQTEITTNGTFGKDSILANNQTFRQVMDDVTASVLRSVEGLTGVKSLSDIGISFTDLAATADAPAVKNVFALDDGALTSALSSNFDKVRDLFGFRFEADNPALAAYSHTNALSAPNFTLSLSPTSSTFRATYTDTDGTHTVNLDATALPGNTGYTLKGQAGTAFEGLVMLYNTSSNADTTINVKTSLGIADFSYNISDAATDTQKGSIATALSGIKKNTDSLNSDITRLNVLVEQYRQQLVRQFSALETAISKANTILQSLSANADAKLAAAG